MKKIPSMRKGREMQERKQERKPKVSVEGGKGKASSNYQTSHPLTPPSKTTTFEWGRSVLCPLINFG